MGCDSGLRGQGRDGICDAFFDECGEQFSENCSVRAWYLGFSGISTKDSRGQGRFLKSKGV